MAQDYSNFPKFFSAEQFAELSGYNADHIRKAAGAFVDGQAKYHRAKLPEGWAAIRWGRMFVIFQQEDAEAIAYLFDTEIPVNA